MSLRTTVTIAILVLSGGGCATDPADIDATRGPESSASPDSGATTELTYDGPQVPDGDYQRTMTLADLNRVGLARVPAEWAPDGTLTNLLRFDGASMAQLANYDGGPMVVGSSGSIAYDVDGRLILDEACCAPGGYTWKVTGDTLTLTPDVPWMEKNAPGFSVERHDDKMWMLMTGGTFTMVG
jgi:hypothetical protein